MYVSYSWHRVHPNDNDNNSLSNDQAYINLRDFQLSKKIKSQKLPQLLKMINKTRNFHEKCVKQEHFFFQ